MENKEKYELELVELKEQGKLQNKKIKNLQKKRSKIDFKKKKEEVLKESSISKESKSEERDSQKGENSRLAVQRYSMSTDPSKGRERSVDSEQ